MVTAVVGSALCVVEREGPSKVHADEYPLMLCRRSFTLWSLLDPRERRPALHAVPPLSFCFRSLSLQLILVLFHPLGFCKILHLSCLSLLA